MSYWNYRVFKTVHTLHDGSTEEVFTIREAFYSDDDRVEGWTAEPCHPQGETLDEIRQDLEWMLKALDAPVLEDKQ